MTESPPRPPLLAPLQELHATSVFQEARWGMALLGPDFTILRVNPALAKLVGRTVEEMVHIPPDRLTHPEDLPRVAAYLAAVRDGGAIAPHIVKRCLLAAGGYAWTETSVTPVRGKDGALAGYLAQLQDVTARHLAEEMLEHQRRIFIGGPVVVFRWINAPGWPVEFVSPNVESEFGWPVRELLDGRLPFANVVHPDDLQRVAAEVAEHAARGADSFDQHYRVRRGDGAVRHVCDRTTVHRDGAGRATHFEGYLIDETARVEAEHELRRGADDLRRLLRISRQLLVPMPPAELMVLAREALQERLGVRNAWIYVLDPSDPDRVTLLAGDGPLVELSRRIAGELRISAIPLLQEAHRADAGVYCRDARTDPRVGRVLADAFGARSLLAAPLHGDGGRLGVLWTGTFGDEGVLEEDPASREFLQSLGGLLALAFGRMRSEEQRRRVEERLRHAEKLEAVGQLAGGMAHNFNNALTVVLGHASLLLEDPELQARHRSALETILRAGHSSAKTVRQLLQFARPEPLDQVESVDPGRVLREFARMLKPLLGEQIRVELRLGDSLPQLRLDGGAFEMILMNLVLNARDAMVGGGILRIRAAGVTIAAEDAGLRGLRAPGTCLRLEVEDTGHGMDEATQARIFEPFFTTKGSGGTGLGLPAVYGAVRQAGGCIEVRSRPGQGACFTILLPEADGRSEEIANAPEQVFGAERVVLVVEDEDAVRLLAARALTASGFKVVAACDAEEALRRLEREHLRPDLLLTDVVMPGRSGLELALRARRHLPDLPVLLMSGYSDENLRLDTGERLPLLRKPFTAAELLRAAAAAMTPAPQA